MSILEIRNLTMRFGGLTAVNRLSLSLDKGQILSIIGPNGAGKTTVFNAITGIYPPTGGKILFNGVDVRRSFEWKDIPFIVGTALCIAVFLFACVHLERLWQVSIVDCYEYQKPFQGTKAWGAFVAYLAQLSVASGGWLFLGGGVSGAAAAIVILQRQRVAPHRIALLGVVRTFQNIRLFQEMSVLENVLIGMETKLRTHVWHMIFRLPFYWEERSASLKKAEAVLRFVELNQHADQLAKNLSYGHQRRLEIARALASSPTLLLLDEPAAGMNPQETAELMKLIHKIRGTGTTVLLIEHHMRLVMGISDKIAVLDYGNKIAEGTVQEIQSNPAVIEAYLGKEETS